MAKTVDYKEEFDEILQCPSAIEAEVPARGELVDKVEEDWDTFQECLPQLAEALMKRGEQHNGGGGLNDGGADTANPTSAADDVNGAPATAATIAPRSGSRLCRVGSDESGEAPAPASSLRKRSARQPVNEEMLALWRWRTPESFEWTVFVRELLGQSIHCFLGAFGFPMLLLNYSSVQGTRNRHMIPHRFTFETSVGICLLASWLVFFIFQPKNITYVELIMDFTITSMRNATVAIKYAYMPRATWDSFNRDTLPQKVVFSFMILRCWLFPSLDIVDGEADLSLFTVLGPSEEDLRLRFLPDTDPKLDVPWLSLREGRITHYQLRRLGQEVSGGDHKGDAARSWPTGDDVEVGDDGARYILMRPFFKLMVRSVMAAEQKQIIWKVGAVALGVVCPISIMLLPCFARLILGKHFFGGDAAGYAYVLLSAPNRLFMITPSMFFLLAAIKDMFRRKTLIRCLCAMLSTHANERKGIPGEIAEGVGLLDVSDAQTLTSLHHLLNLSMAWGRPWSRRCTAFTNCFAGLAAMLMGWTWLLVEIEDVSLLSPTLILMVVTMVTHLAGLIVVQAIFGGDVNNGASRLEVLLRRHANCLRSPALLPEGASPSTAATMSWMSRPMRERVLAAEAIEAAATGIQSEHAADPMSICGMPCGIQLLSTLYVVPLMFFSRLSAYCVKNPETRRMCFLDGTVFA